MRCLLCPRRCGANRSIGQLGACGCTDRMRVARAAPHFWEEPPISGVRGSGAVFFSGCSLGCVYCQNHALSTGTAGVEVSPGELADLMLRLQARGVHNINFVTGTHFVPQIVRSVQKARRNGLHVPIVWNSSGYELPETIEFLRGTVDVYMPDVKYWDGEWARRASAAHDYPVTARRALQVMRDQQPADVFGEDGTLLQGLLVRHLVLPGHTLDAKNILRHLRDAFGRQVLVSVMRQYVPPARTLPVQELRRGVTKREYASVLAWAMHLGLENVFVQGPGSATDDYLPSFTSDPGVLFGGPLEDGSA